MKTASLLLGAVLALFSLSTARGAITIYGSLGNFDAINDTGLTAHGFEIELDGCSPSDVFATFGSPYNRYGDPTITSNGAGGTIVRYASAYDSSAQTWAAGTDSGSMPDTGGHSLFFPAYGGHASYPNVPGDHFGIAVNVNVTNTTYHWLLDGGSGTLVLAGTAVKIPAPVLTVVPPAVPANPPVVQAVVPAPPPDDPGAEFGEAIWVKVFTTVVESGDPAELHDLVLGNAAVPPETETEVEWQLLQAGNQDVDERADAVEVGEDYESVTRRYEYYRYLGDYDPETHEALNDAYDPALVGDYLGGQNVAANFGVLNNAVPEPSTLLIWSLLGGLGIVIGCLRQKRAA